MAKFDWCTHGQHTLCIHITGSGLTCTCECHDEATYGEAS